MPGPRKATASQRRCGTDHTLPGCFCFGLGSYGLNERVAEALRKWQTALSPEHRERSSTSSRNAEGSRLGTRLAMMATTKRILEHEPSDLELLLPWHAAGTLNARDARRVEDALARDPELARQYAVIREEYAATIGLNENLGAPSMRAMQKLFAAIDAEPARRPAASRGLIARLTPRFIRPRLG